MKLSEYGSLKKTIKGVSWKNPRLNNICLYKLGIQLVTGFLFVMS